MVDATDSTKERSTAIMKYGRIASWTKSIMVISGVVQRKLLEA